MVLFTFIGIQVGSVLGMVVTEVLMHNIGSNIVEGLILSVMGATLGMVAGAYGDYRAYQLFF